MTYKSNIYTLFCTYNFCASTKVSYSFGGSSTFKFISKVLGFYRRYRFYFYGWASVGLILYALPPF